jgi:hypothetical protein
MPNYLDSLIDSYVDDTEQDTYQLQKYIVGLIDKYSSEQIDGKEACRSISNITRRDEWIQDVNSNRLKEKIKQKYSFVRYAKSPEDIIIEWETAEKILHFLTWLHSIINHTDWYILTQMSFRKIPATMLAREMNIPRDTIYKRLSVVRNVAKEFMPYYAEQFGDIKEYLED